MLKRLADSLFTTVSGALSSTVRFLEVCPGHENERLISGLVVCIAEMLQI